MAEIKPEIKEIPKYSILICPFCQGEWEFRLSDTFENAQIIFYCQKCKKRIVISKL